MINVFFLFLFLIDVHTVIVVKFNKIWKETYHQNEWCTSMLQMMECFMF